MNLNIQFSLHNMIVVASCLGMYLFVVVVFFTWDRKAGQHGLIDEANEMTVLDENLLKVVKLMTPGWSSKQSYITTISIKMNGLVLVQT